MAASPHIPSWGVEECEENTNMDTQGEMTSGRMASVAVDVGPATSTEAAPEPTTATARATTMKAIVQDQYGSSKVLALKDIDKPEIGPAEVLIRVRAAAVNPGDWAVMSGLPYI